jgi:hypothetical protein
MTHTSRSPIAQSTLASLARSLKQRLQHWLLRPNVQTPCASFEPLEQRLQFSAPTPVDSQFQVNTLTASHQRHSAVATAPDGSFVIVWDSITDGSVAGVYGQRYNTSGQKVGVEFQINTYTTSFQQYSDIAIDSKGNFVVVWESTGQDTSNLGVYGQRYDSSGDKLGGEFQVNTYTLSNQKSASIAMNDDGSFVVAWQSMGQDGNLDGIYAQRYDASGAQINSEFQVNTYTTGFQTVPDIAVNDSGGFVIVWASNGQDGDLNGIYGQLFNSSGAKEGAEFQVNTWTTSGQGDPRATFTNNGNFIVTWASNTQDGSVTGVYAQRFDSAASKLGSEFRVNTYTPSYQQAPSIAVDTQGNFLIAWESSFDKSYEIRAQFFDVSGNPQDSEFTVNTSTAETQTNSTVAISPTGNVIISWTTNDSKQDGDGYAVLAQRYTLSTNTAPTTTGIADTNLYDTASSSVTLPTFFSDDSDAAADLIYTVESNSNSSLITNLAVDKFGVLTFDITSGMSAAADITIRSTDSQGLYVEDTFTINAIAAIDFTAKSSLNDYPTDQSINLYDAYSIPAFARPFISFDSIKSYSGDTLFTDSSVSKNKLNLTLNHTLGSGKFTLDASIFSIIPVHPSVTVTVVDSTPLTVTSVINPTSPSTVAIDYVDFTFSQAIDVTSFDWTSITLSYNFGLNQITSSTPVEITLLSGTTYRISGFKYNASKYTGSYELTLVEGGVTNTIGKPLSGSAQANWTMDAPPPQILNSSDYDVPRVVPVSAIAVRLSQPADLSTFTWEDLVLTRDGGANLTNSGITIALSSWDPNVYQIFFPADIMAPSGNYQLTINGEDMRTQAGGIGFMNSTVTNWTILAKMLNASQFTTPRTVPVTSVAVRLSEPCNLSTFTWEDLYLSIDGGFNIASDQITVAVSGWDPSVYQITLPTSLVSAAGNYLLTISGNNIRTLSNNVAYATNSTSSWTQLGKVLNLSEFPTPRTTPVTSVAVRFSDAINLSTFNWNDIFLYLNAGPNLSTPAITVALSSYDPKVYIITLPSSLTTAPGNYMITVNGTTTLTPSGVPMSNSSSTTWTQL